MAYEIIILKKSESGTACATVSRPKSKKEGLGKLPAIHEENQNKCVKGQTIRTALIPEVNPRNEAEGEIPAIIASFGDKEISMFQRTHLTA